VSNPSPAPSQPGSHLERYQRERDHTQLLLEVNNAVVSSLGLLQLINAISLSLRQVIPHDAAFISLCDADVNHIRVQALNLQAPETALFEEGVSIPAEGTPEALAITSRRPVLVSPVIDLKRFPSLWVQSAVDQGARSGCTAPLIVGDHPLGALTLVSRQENSFSEESAVLLEQCASQIAIAVENALQFEQLRAAEREVARERDRKQLLLEVNNAVVSNLSLPELLKSISTSLRRVVPHDAAFLILHDKETNLIRLQALDMPVADRGMFEAGLAISPEGTPEGQAIASRQPVLGDTREFTSPWARKAFDQGVRSGCTTPLIVHDRVLGALSVISMKENSFNEDDAALLEQCAGQIAIAVENALAYQEIAALKDRLAQEKLYLEDEIRSEINFEEIIGQSDGLRTVLHRVQTVAPSDSTVLILGETGTGKELIARAIHESSPRKGRTFVKLNCAAIPTGLLESELFGHERGAFTGAIAQKIGRMELANGGTLFLDEVGDIPLELQPKLLRALQEREFERLGSVRTQKSDVRFIAATNQNLQRMVADKQFRSDLFYRLNVFPINIPSLRERKDDVPRLVRYFVSKYTTKMGKQIDTIPTAAMAKLQAWHWPGNVRELENFIERSVILTNGPSLFVSLSELESAAGDSDRPPETLRETDREHILRILRETRGVLAGPSGAAARLGLKRTTLQYKIKKLGITPDDY
jgi:formate hydrogenlyase transcriptional activator